MNWLHFSIWTTGLYLLYYLVVILLDLAASRRAPAASAAPGELTFAEPMQPEKLRHEPEEDLPDADPPNAAERRIPAITATGGVRLKDFFNLAKQESIIYTRPVSFV